MATVLDRGRGILTPPNALSKRERVMARSKFLRLLRHMDFSRARGLLTRFECATCRKPVRVQRGESALIQTDGANNTINPKTDVFSLSCDCTVWTVK